MKAWERPVRNVVDDRIVVPLWPSGDLSMVSGVVPYLDLHPKTKKGSSEAEVVVNKFIFIWLLMVILLSTSVLPNWATGTASFWSIAMTSTAALSMLLIRKLRGISFLIIENYMISFVSVAAGKVDKFESFRLHQLKSVKLRPARLFGRPMLEFLFYRKLKVVLLPLNSFPSRERWHYFVDACLSVNPSTEFDPAIDEQLLPDPKESSYTELWLSALGSPPKRERLLPVEPGTKLKGGEYEIVRQLGSGGQGTAYLATRCLTGANASAASRANDKGKGERSVNANANASEEVVLKEYMLPVYVDMKARKQALESFEHEARMLSRLESDLIAQLLDFFVEDHRGYLAIEYVSGDSLRTRVEKNGPVREKEAIELGLGMCDILIYLQEQQPPVVHRDFTPDNLMMRDDGALKLIDFMVAQEGDASESSLTSTIVGKQSYMPPEQFRGKTSIRSDIYACGATLFFLMTGRDPEALTQSNLLVAVDAVSVELHDIVARATSLDEKVRFQSAREMKDTLIALSHSASNLQDKPCA